MLEAFFKYPKVLARLRFGPLGAEMDEIAARFFQVGYTRESARAYLTRIARFGRFAARVGHDRPQTIGRDVAERFLLRLKTAGARIEARTAINHALRHVEGKLPAPREHDVPADPDTTLLAAFDEHLRDVRGLQRRTREGMVLGARRVVRWYRATRPGRPLSSLSGEDVLSVAGHLSAACATDGSRSATVSYVRAFLRYLEWAAVVDSDLARLVPRTPRWRLAHLPARLSWEDIRRVISAIDPVDSHGKRDRALLLLLATTGMRSQELRRLELPDIRWRAGEVLVRRTKTRRERVVPLLEEPGRALAEYVLHGRPHAPAPQVFLGHRPPIGGLGSSSAVAAIVHRRLVRCDLDMPRAGAHLLRHSLACRLVGEGRPIKEIADLLGHRSIDTTAIYVKVALPQLASVALPFPGGRP